MPPGPREEASPADLSCPACQERYPANVSFCPKDGSRLVPGEVKAAERPERPSLVGQVLADRYRIVRKIGEGGMGEVFEAQHIYIDKRYAIKTLRPEITTNPEAVARFHQEARSASTIGHENIIEIDDFGRLSDGCVYLAMEFLDGKSLAERMREPPLIGISESLGYMIQVARGLAAAHGKGIIHRDLKPENIFLARKNDRAIVKVLDFGIAKVTSESSQQHLTQTGAIFGTPFYMSPEQALGKPLDARTDIYSIGVILYEVCAGTVPFHGESFMGILSQHITAPPVPPSQAAPHRRIPPRLERVIMRAMAKDPAERFPTMEVLVDELTRLARETSMELQLDEGRDPPLTALRDTVERPLEQALDPELQSLATEVPSEPIEELGLEELPAAPRRGRLFALAAVSLLVIGGAATGWVLRTREKPAITTTTARVSSSVPAPIVTPRPSPPPVAAPREAPPPADSAVVLDTIPPGAKVFAQGRLIAETPDAVKVPQGKTLEVLIRKDGFVARQVVLDPERDPKLIVRLERERRGGSSSSRPLNLPQPPPGVVPDEEPPARTAPSPARTPPAPARTAPAPARTNPPARRTAPSHAPADDIYQTLPSPPRRPATRPQKTDVMNPYD